MALEEQHGEAFLETSHGIPDLSGAMTVLTEIFETSRPDMLYIPTVSSDRPSSVQVHKLALGLGKDVSKVLAYQDPRATEDFRPGLFVDVAPQMARKIELVALYDRFGLENVSTELAKATAVYWGRYGDAVEVEPLEVISRGGG